MKVSQTVTLAAVLLLAAIGNAVGSNRSCVITSSSDSGLGSIADWVISTVGTNRTWPFSRDCTVKLVNAIITDDWSDPGCRTCFEGWTEEDARRNDCVWAQLPGDSIYNWFQTCEESHPAFNTTVGSSCPAEWKTSGDCGPNVGLECEYGQQCCCGECKALTISTCTESGWMGMVVDAWVNCDESNCDGEGENGFTTMCPSDFPVCDSVGDCITAICAREVCAWSNGENWISGPRNDGTDCQSSYRGDNASEFPSEFRAETPDDCIGAGYVFCESEKKCHNPSITDCSYGVTPEDPTVCPSDFPVCDRVGDCIKAICVREQCWWSNGENWISGPRNDGAYCESSYRDDTKHECPTYFHEADTLCYDVGMECGYGEECCCGECHPIAKAVCSEDGLWNRTFIEACVDVTECGSWPSYWPPYTANLTWPFGNISMLALTAADNETNTPSPTWLGWANDTWPAWGNTTTNSTWPAWANTTTYSTWPASFNTTNNSTWPAWANDTTWPEWGNTTNSSWLAWANNTWPSWPAWANTTTNSTWPASLNTTWSASANDTTWQAWNTTNSTQPTLNGSA